MKILMVDALVGNDYAECLCSGLNKAGADISLVVPENKATGVPVNFPIKKWSPTKTKSVGKLGKITKYLKYQLRILNYVLRNHIDIVHYQFFRRKSEIFFFALLRLLGVNMVFTAHNVLPHDKKKIDTALQWLVYTSAKAIIVHSSFIKKKLQRDFKLDPNKIHVIPHGNYDAYLPDKFISQIDARKQLNLSRNDNVLLFFGNIKSYKGLDLLLDAFQIAAAEDPKLKLIIAGAADSERLEHHYENKIQQMSVEKRIIQHIKFIPVEDIPLYFIASDLVALPYKNIYHSGVVHLAFSFARPVLATDVGDFREMLEHGKCGYISEKNEARSFAETILVAFSDKEKLSQMGAFAKQLSERKYSWDDIARKTSDLYKRVIIKK